MTTRQTLRDFLTSVGSSKTSIALPVDPGPDGVINEGDDLGIEPQTGKPLLDFTSGDAIAGDYVSYITQQNMYPLAGGAHEAPVSNRGSALANAETQSATSVFAENAGTTNPYALNRSNSGLFDASGNPVNTLVSKTGSGTAPTGNELYEDVIPASSDAESVPDQSKVVKAAFSMLRKYNNISPTGERDGYVGQYDTTTQFNDVSVTRIQTGMGEYEAQTVILSADIAQDDLSRIAHSMILRATGWDTTQLPVDAANPDEFMQSVSGDTLEKFPSITRTTPAGPDAYRARDAYGMPQGAGGESKLEGTGDAVKRTAEDSNYTNTLGSAYTPDNPFIPNSNNPVNLRIQALQAGIAMVGLGVIIEKTLNNNNAYLKELQVSSDQVLRGPYYMGTSLKSRVTTKVRALVRSFMFQTGIYSYAACVSEGLYATFGFKSLNAINLPIEVDTPFLARRYREEILNIANNAGEGANYDSPLGMTHGFWRSVAESAMKIISRIQRSTANADAIDFSNCVLTLSDSLAVRVLNVFAQIGYQRLIIQTIPTAEAKSGGTPKNPWDVDSYKNAPGTRQMKSRDGELLSKTSLAWRNSSLPSMFLLPVEAMSATLDMDFMFDKDKGSNPIKGMLGSTLYDKVYVNATKNQNLIPAAVAKRLEDRLGAEYMPFYFRDMRTNEIIAFHGFLDSITDAYTPNHVTTRGFGRADGVKNYSDTKRSIGGSFWVVATSKEDFDEMWFKINKLTTLAYPQYTRGREVSAPDPSLLFGKDKTLTFEQPFSQLVGATPLIRMRVGDLIKTNYSRYNLSRIFGAGNDRFGVESDKLKASDLFRLGSSVGGLVPAKVAKIIDVRLAPFLLYAASPMEISRWLSIAASGAPGPIGGMLNATIDAAADFFAYSLKNGFVNPALYGDRTKIFKSGQEELGDFGEVFNTFLVGAGTTLLKARSTPYIAESSGDRNVSTNSKFNLRIERPILVKVGKQVTNESGIAYEVTINDYTVGPNLQNVKIVVAASDLYIDAASIVDVSSLPGALLSLGLITNLAGNLANLASSAVNIRSAGSDVGPIDLPLADVVGSFGRTLTSPIYNAITRAFEERMGEGLAGVFTNLSFTWTEAPWETDWNSRAPMACKVQFSFDPIHDISPGLDANGFNRAPIYNVGQIMHDSFGSSRQDGGNASRYFYKRGGSVAENAKNPEKS